MNNKSKFNILNATMNGYQFVFREWRYLFGLGLLPATVSFMTLIFVRFERPDAEFIEEFLWELPSTMLFAWYMFQQTRLIIFGERIDALPKDAGFVNERQHALRLSIICWLLFNMALMAVMTYMLWMTKNQLAAGDAAPQNPVNSGIAMILLGATFWGVRFGVVHILTAVGYSLRDFIFRANGVMFSLRLIGLGVLTVLPMAFVLQALLGLLITDEKTAGGIDFILIAVLSAVMSLLVTSVLNAAAVYALKEMLGRDEPARVNR